MDNVINPLMEWAVWGHLADEKSRDLLLLKGHLFIEVALDSVLIKNKVNDYEYYSFHKKIQVYSELDFKNKFDHELIVSLLIRLNKIRNRLAHDWDFDIDKSELESWVINVHSNFKGVKFSNYTDRTKIVHAFSVLTKNILRLDEENK